MTAAKGKGAGQERWNKGRAWDGIGPWCDEATSEEMLRWLEDNFDVSKDIDFYLEAMAARVPDKRAITYVDQKAREASHVTFVEVQTYSRRIASYLQRDVGLRPGERVVLMFPPGQEFILAFLGCVKAGVVPVAVYPPHPYRLDHELPALQHIVTDCGARVALTDGQYNLVIRGVALTNMLSKLGLTKFKAWPELRYVRTDKIRHSHRDETLPEPPSRRGRDVAYIQYTAGSTGTPKGVMVSHGNVIAQIQSLLLRGRPVTGYTNNINMVSWVPMYHDTGLVGMCLVSLAAGNHLISMTPMAFLQDPSLWLVVCDKYRATYTCAPVFALDLARRRTPEAMLSKLDLSPLKVLSVGAAMLHAADVSAFTEHFKRCGLDPHCISPAYGLAEFTMCATAHSFLSPLPVLRIDRSTFTDQGIVTASTSNSPDDVMRLVGVGRPQSSSDGTEVRIVEPSTGSEQGDGRVGEIWLSGPLKAVGYFNQPEMTRGQLEAELAGDSGADGEKRAWLRTGDAGFMWEGVLFVVGRIKDVVSIRGRTYYPPEIEAMVERQLARAIKPGCSAAFVCESGGKGQGVGYVAELRAKVKDAHELRDIAEQAQRCIARSFKVPVSAVVLIEPRSIPKTNNGQIQRFRCKQGYEDGSLKALHVWEADGTPGRWPGRQ